MVLTTTNGTKAINIAKQDHFVVTGSFLNLKALTSFLVEMDKGIIILCAGWKNDFLSRGYTICWSINKGID